MVLSIWFKQFISKDNGLGKTKMQHKLWVRKYDNSEPEQIVSYYVFHTELQLHVLATIDTQKQTHLNCATIGPEQLLMPLWCHIRVNKSIEQI